MPPMEPVPIIPILLTSMVMLTKYLSLPVSVRWRVARHCHGMARDEPSFFRVGILCDDAHDISFSMMARPLLCIC